MASILRLLPHARDLSPSDSVIAFCASSRRHEDIAPVTVTRGWIDDKPLLDSRATTRRAFDADARRPVRSPLHRAQFARTHMISITVRDARQLESTGDWYPSLARI